MGYLGKMIRGAVVLSAFLLPATARADSWFQCQLTEYVDTGNRISVHCSNGWSEDSNVHYVAMGFGDAAKAQRFWTAVSTAFLSGKKLWVYLPTSASSNTTSCAASDCRTPSQFQVSNVGN